MDEDQEQDDQDPLPRASIGNCRQVSEAGEGVRIRLKMRIG